MRTTQDDIKTIQSKLQAMRESSSSRTAVLPPMVELRPEATANPHRAHTASTATPQPSHSRRVDSNNSETRGNRTRVVMPLVETTAPAATLPIVEQSTAVNTSVPTRTIANRPVQPAEVSDRPMAHRPIPSYPPSSQPAPGLSTVRQPPISQTQVESKTVQRIIQAEHSTAELPLEVMTLLTETLNKRSQSYVEPAEPAQAAVTVEPISPVPSTPPPTRPATTEWVPPERSLAALIAQLDVQAQQINQLSSAQEEAMRDFKRLAQRAERDLKAIKLEKGPIATEEDYSLCQYHDTMVPWIEKDKSGAFVLQARPVDLFQAERDAAQMAVTLRDRQHQTNTPTPKRRVKANRRHQGGVNLNKLGGTLLGGLSSAITALQPTAKSYSPSARKPTFSLQQGFFCLFAGVLARMAIDIVLTLYPVMWVPVIGLIIAPAAFAVYRTSFAPQGGFFWAARLMLIMAGLLLGGRL